MAEIKMQHDLDGAAIVASILINTNRKPGSAAVSAVDCNPYRKSQGAGIRLTSSNLKTMAQAVVKKPRKNKS